MTCDRGEPVQDHQYEAFGLRIASEIPLPELARSEASASGVDVTVRLGELGDVMGDLHLVDTGVFAAPGRVVIDQDEARLLVRDGREIVVEPKPGASLRDVRVYILGSAMGAVLHQRAVLPLHANAVEVDGRAIAFAGASGAGKSTLAAYFQSKGHRVLCDDVCAITFDDDGSPLAWPGIPRIKLWTDSLHALGHDGNGLDRVWGDESKYSLPITSGGVRSPLPLHRIYVLDSRSQRGEIKKLAGAAAVDALVGNIYRWEYAHPLNTGGAQFNHALALLKGADIFSMPSARHYGQMDLTVQRLKRHFFDTL